MGVQQGKARADLALAAAILLFQIPAADLVARLAPAKTDAAIGHHQLARGAVDQQGLPVRVIGLIAGCIQLRSAQEIIGHQTIAMRAQLHQHRHVGVAADVIAEVIRLAVGVEFLQDHMAHRHRQRGVGALFGREPDVAELDHLAKVAGNRHRLGALVAHLGVEMRIRRARLRHVRAPHHQVGRVIPVGRFGHIGLLAPDLRAGRRQIAVPVVKAHAHAANQRQITAAGGVADHAHGRNRRETDHAIRAIGLDRVGIRSGDDLGDFIPARAHKTALPAHALVALGLGRVLADRFPGRNRVHALTRLAPHFHQPAADHRVLHALRRIHIPAVRRPARAAAWFVIGQIGTGARVIGLLGFPGDQAVFHIDLP